MAPPIGSITWGRFRPNASADPVLHRPGASTCAAGDARQGNDGRSQPLTEGRPGYVGVGVSKPVPAAKPGVERMWSMLEVHAA